MTIKGNTVGTPLSLTKIEEKLQPVKTINGVLPDESGNVEVSTVTPEILEEYINDATKVYVQSEEPTNATNGVIWIDIDEDPEEDNVEYVTKQEVQDFVDEAIRDMVTAETDPTVPEWAKQPQKPTYTAVEVGALPNTTEIPTKLSELLNDAGFVTADDIPEADIQNEIFVQPEEPTDAPDGTIWLDTDGLLPASNIPDWAKQPEKPKYTADEVGAAAEEYVNDAITALNNHVDNKLKSKLDKTNGTASGLAIEQYLQIKSNSGNGAINFTATGTEDDENECLHIDSANGYPRINGIGAPVEQTDVANKKYVDDKFDQALEADVPTYVQPDEPIDAPVGAIWYDTDEEGENPVFEKQMKDYVDNAVKNIKFTESDPTVPNWAKQAKKPDYTADEVGALSVDTTLKDLKNDAGFITLADLSEIDIDNNTYIQDTVPEDAPDGSIWLNTSKNLPPSNIPEWAKQPNKPTYTAAEVGAATPEDITNALANLPTGGDSPIEEIFRLTTTEEVKIIETGINLNEYAEIWAYCRTLPVEGSTTTRFDWWFVQGCAVGVANSLYDTQRRCHFAYIKNLGNKRLHVNYGYGYNSNSILDKPNNAASDANLTIFSHMEQAHIVDNVNTNFKFGVYIYGNATLGIGTEVLIFGRK